MMPIQEAQALLEPCTRRGFVFSGQAVFTIVSIKTKQRFTYRVRKLNGHTFFVDGLAGPNNEEDYRYLGTIHISDAAVFYRPSKKSSIASSAPLQKAFAWFAAHMEDARFELWHEGRCGRCARRLTDPESIARGLGPFCSALA